jgi:hypothetical protein
MLLCFSAQYLATSKANNGAKEQELLIRALSTFCSLFRNTGKFGLIGTKTQAARPLCAMRSYHVTFNCC